MIPPIAVVNLPAPIRSGPAAAIKAPIVTIVFRVSSSRLFNQSTALCIPAIIGVRNSARTLPREVISTSRELLTFSNDPPKPPIMASAISSVVPLVLSMTDCKPPKSPPSAFTICSNETPPSAASQRSSANCCALPPLVFSMSSKSLELIPSFSRFDFISSIEFPDFPKFFAKLSTDIDAPFNSLDSASTSSGAAFISASHGAI